MGNNVLGIKMINNATINIGENVFDTMSVNIKNKNANLNAADGASNFADFLTSDIKEENIDNIENTQKEETLDNNIVEKPSSENIEEKNDINKDEETKITIPPFWLALQMPIENQEISLEVPLQDNLKIDVNTNISGENNGLQTILNSISNDIEINIDAQNQTPLTFDENVNSNNPQILEENIVNQQGTQLSQEAINELSKLGIGDKNPLQKEILAKINNQVNTDSKPVKINANKELSPTIEENSEENIIAEFENLNSNNGNIEAFNFSNIENLSPKQIPQEKEKAQKINVEIANDNLIETDFSFKNEASELQSSFSNDVPKLNINNLDAIAATLIKKAANGEKTFFVRLDPAELGKIEVELKFGQDSKLTAIIKAETPQALNELMRSAKDLVLSLNQAGLEMKEQDLSFNLNNGFDNSQNNFANQKNNQEQKNLFTNKSLAQETNIQEEKIAKPIKHEIWGQTRISIRA